MGGVLQPTGYLEGSMKKTISIIAGIIVVFLYLSKIYTPSYDGRLTIDIRNNTWTPICDIYLTYADSETTVEIPDIRPQERLVILPRPDDVSVPVTKLYLHYNNQVYELMNAYRPIVNNGVIITFGKNSVDIYDMSYQFLDNIYKSIYYKPIFRIFDLAKTP